MHTFPFQSILRVGVLVLQLIKNFIYCFFNYSSLLSGLLFPCGTCIIYVRSPGPLPEVLSLPSQFSFFMFSPNVFGNSYCPWSSRLLLYISFNSCIKLLRCEIIFVTSTKSPKCSAWTSEMFLLVLYSSWQVFAQIALLAEHGFCLFWPSSLDGCCFSLSAH